MKKVGRPRKPKSEKKEIISVNLPSHLVEKLNHDLSWSQSRSKWIETAIKNKLKRKLPDIDEYRLTTLVFTAKEHKDCPRWLKRELSYYLESTVKKQVEEIEEEQ